MNNATNGAYILSARSGADPLTSLHKTVVSPEENHSDRRSASEGLALSRISVDRCASGHMLVNWYLSELSEDSSLQPLKDHNLKLLAVQFCTHLLAAGVLKQIPEKDVPMFNIFKVNSHVRSISPVSLTQINNRTYF